jgi:hypothetical protein
MSSAAARCSFEQCVSGLETLRKIHVVFVDYPPALMLLRAP